MKLRILAVASLVLAGMAGPVHAGFVVDKFQGNGAGGGSLARADLVIAGTYFTPNQTLGTVFSTLNFSDNGSFGIAADPTNLWPDNTNNDDFVIHATGLLNIASAGSYTFRTNNDDGIRLRIGGSTIISDPGYHGPADFTATTFLTVGLHAIDLVYFEGGGIAALELQVRNTNNQFVLLGDTANGGLEVLTSAPVPEPISIAMWGFGTLGLTVARRRRRQVELTAC